MASSLFHTYEPPGFLMHRAADGDGHYTAFHACATANNPHRGLYFPITTRINLDSYKIFIFELPQDSTRSGKQNYVNSLSVCGSPVVLWCTWRRIWQNRLSWEWN